MKILPLVNNITQDVTTSGLRLKNATTYGYKIGSRAANIYKQNKIKKYINISRVVSDKVVKGTSKEELPYMAGAIGMLIPLPLASPLLLLLGFIARFSIPDTTFSNKNNNKNSKK